MHDVYLVSRLSQFRALWSQDSRQLRSFSPALSKGIIIHTYICISFSYICLILLYSYTVRLKLLYCAPTPGRARPTPGPDPDQAGPANAARFGPAGPGPVETKQLLGHPRDHPGHPWSSQGHPGSPKALFSFIS